MARARCPFLLLAAGLLTAAPAAGQHITSPYRYVETRQYAGVFGGHLGTQTGVVDLGPTGGNIFGGFFGYRVSGPFVAELSVAYVPMKRVVRDTVRSTPDTATFASRGTARQNVLLATVDMRFDITGARTYYGLQPYLLLGVGGAIGTSGQNGADTVVPQDVRFKFGTSFAAQAGGGIEWYVTRHAGLRLDARGTLWKLHTPQAFILRGPVVPQSEWVQNLSVAGGLAIHF